MTGQIWVALVIGVAALRRHRMRSLLTMLGMMVGVAAVIGIAAVGSGAKQAIEDRITASGANMVVVRAGAWEVDEAGNVAVFGPAVRDEVFGKGASAVGRILRVGSCPCG